MYNLLIKYGLNSFKIHLCVFIIDFYNRFLQ